MSFLKGNKNKRKRILSIIGLVFLIVAVFAGIVLVQQNQDIREDAAGGCKFITDPKVCGGACGASKSNGDRFKCRWNAKNNKCGETSKQCGGGGSGNITLTSCATIGGVCMDNTASGCWAMVSTSDCKQSDNLVCCVAAPPCSDGATTTKSCGMGKISNDECIKYETKKCVNGEWKVTRKCACVGL